MPRKGIRKYTDGVHFKLFMPGEEPEGWRPITNYDRPSIKARLSKKKEKEAELHTKFPWKRSSKIEIFPWMSEAYGLSGIELFVYSLIYNELEMSPHEIELLIGEDPSPYLYSLRDRGLIETKSGRGDDNHLWKQGEHYIWVANEDMII